MIVVQVGGLSVGYTQASRVIPLVRSKESESFTVTRLNPSKLRALPNLPWLVQVAPLIVPVLPNPDTSVTVVPLPSSKLYPATSPATVVTSTFGGGSPDDACAIEENRHRAMSADRNESWGPCVQPLPKECEYLFIN